MEQLNIITLGELALQAGENRVSAGDSRSKKGWLLIAYLICRRGQVIAQKDLITLLWGNDPVSSNPDNALRITFHRARTMLDTLWPHAGRDLILFKDDGYLWNDRIPAELDADVFERLCRSTGPNRLEAAMDALAMYKGMFLDKFSTETWVIPFAAHYHNLYLSTAMSATTELMLQNRYEEAIRICRSVIALEPCHEPLHQLLIQSLSAVGRSHEAGTVFDALNSRLFHDFGITPSEETKAAYRAAVYTPSTKTVTMDMVLQQTREQDLSSGALYCDYDYFKMFCYAKCRGMERSGQATHLALLSITGETRPLSDRVLKNAVVQLSQHIHDNLRRCDVYSQCSVSQFILMLPGANYENSCLVCRRIAAAFARSHPHTSARLQFQVHPLEPGISMP